MTIEGYGPYEIARIRFDDKIETPAVYFGKQNKGIWKSKEEFTVRVSNIGYTLTNSSGVKGRVEICEANTTRP